jgi:hypothetical protein
MPFQVTESMNIDELLTTVTDLNMTSIEAIDFIYGALDIVRARNKRVFNYSAAVAAAQPAACRPDFVRSFSHIDWIDGESIVQAEETTMEDGFNSRFHSIEDDLDALASDVAQAFVCIGDQRAQIAQALIEIRTELNRLNTDVFECCDEPSTGGGGWVYPGNIYPYPWAEPAPYPNPTPPYGGGHGPWVNPGNIGTWTGGNLIYPVDMTGQPGMGNVPWGNDVIDPVVSYVNAIKGHQNYEGANANILRNKTDPSRGVVAGMQARLIETSEFNGQAVEVWATSAGIIMTPLVDAGDVTETGVRAAWTNPRIEVTSRFARWAADNEKQVSEKLGGEFSMADFARAFGDAKIEGGITISDVVDRLPTDIKAKSPLAFVAPLAEANGKAVVREGFASETVIGAVGLNADAKGGVARTEVGSLKSLPTKIAEAMTRIGLKTVGELASAPTTQVHEKLRSAGVEISFGQAAAYGAQAAAVAAIDKFARGGGR